MVSLSPIGSQEMIRIVTAHKRRLGQGNIFTPVCQSFCSWGKVYPSMQWAGGVCIPAWDGLGCVWPWGFDQGCVLPGDVTGDM